MKKIELKQMPSPCPFCGADCATVVAAVNRDGKQDKKHVCVLCIQCGARGSQLHKASSENAAITEWNDVWDAVEEIGLFEEDEADYDQDEEEEEEKVPWGGRSK
jgi:transcription elongation factor Elf1